MRRSWHAAVRVVAVLAVAVDVAAVVVQQPVPVQPQRVALLPLLV